MNSSYLNEAVLCSNCPEPSRDEKLPSSAYSPLCHSPQFKCCYNSFIFPLKPHVPNWMLRTMHFSRRAWKDCFPMFTCICEAPLPISSTCPGGSCFSVTQQVSCHASLSPDPHSTPDYLFIYFLIKFGFRKLLRALKYSSFIIFTTPAFPLHSLLQFTSKGTS